MQVLNDGGSIFSRIYNRNITCKAVSPTLDYRLWGTCTNSSIKIDRDNQLNLQGIFGLKYSDDGKLLGAACESNAVVFIDPLTGNVIAKRENAHRKHCNTINFLNSRMFTTCSDDCTVGLWDLRNLKSYVMMLHGHTNWVKNVEFHKPSGCLISSSFDKSIRIWNINKPISKSGCKSAVLLKCDVLRMRISKDCESMYLTSLQGFDCAAVHDFTFTDIDEAIALVKSKQLKLYSVSNYEEAVVCLSLFVHPKNHAIVVRHDSFESDSIVTSVINMKDLQCGNPSMRVEAGTITNMLHIDDNRSMEYIQEVSFSSCGRLLASPLGYGVQILSFDDKLNDYQRHVTEYLKLQQCITSQKEGIGSVKQSVKKCFSNELHEVACCFGHKSHVLSTAFSPVHYQVATGSINGHVIFHEPKL